MNESLFEPLFIQFKQYPSALIPLPTEEERLEQFFLEGKLHNLKLASLGQMETVKGCLVFVDACVLQAASDPIFQAWADWCHGLAWLTHDPLMALPHFERGYAQYERLGKTHEASRILGNIAFIFGRLGRLAEAEEALWRIYDHLKPYPEYVGWPAFYLNLSLIQGLQGEYENMLANARQAEKKARTFGDSIIESKALINQAFAARFLGQLDDAQDVLQRAHTLAVACKAPELIGKALINLARLQTYRSNLFEALRLLNKARDCFHAAELTINLATADIEEATLYEQLGMLKEARQAAIRAADAFENKVANESVEARLLAVRFALMREQPRKAISYLEQAAALLPQVAGTFQAMWQAYRAHPLLQKNALQREAALVQANQAVVRLKEIGAVKEQLEAALIAAALSVEPTKHYQQLIERAQQAGFPALEQQACEGLARHLPAAQAIKPLQQAFELARQTRQRMPVEELKATLLTGQSTLFSRLIEAYLHNQEPLRACEALLEAKGAIWAELATTSEPIEPAPEWVRAKTELLFWREEWYEAQENTPYKTHCQAQIKEAQATLQTIARSQVRKRTLQRVPELSSVQAALSTCAIEYIVTENSIWACVLRPNQPPQWVQVGQRARVARLLRRFNPLRGDLSSRPAEKRLAAAQAQQPAVDKLLTRLYDHLLQPLAPFLPAEGSLLIAPDHFLFEVPWAALRHQDHYLVEQYELSLLPSTALVALPIEPPTEKRANTPKTAPLALGYAGDLHYVEAELHAIQQALPTFRRINPARTSDMPTNNAPPYLHIAAHGQINRQSPLLSSLSFSDGPFLLAETFNLSLQGTELVTLSACETGTTPERGGVTLALAGAFLTAGAQAVLASLWAIDDQATSLLMSHLYRHLLTNNSLPYALAHAQRDLITQGFAHPYYWAAFQPLARTIG